MLTLGGDTGDTDSEVTWSQERQESPFEAGHQRSHELIAAAFNQSG